MCVHQYYYIMNMCIGNDEDVRNGGYQDGRTRQRPVHESWNANRVTTRETKTDGDDKNKANKLAADRSCLLLSKQRLARQSNLQLINTQFLGLWHLP